MSPSLARFVSALTLFFVLSSGAAWAASDLYTVSDIKVDATAESATAARDNALAMGRPVAWTELYRRLTPQSSWSRQPQLNDAALLRLVRSFEVVNERRSTTRYLADVTYHFNVNEVRRLLRDLGPLADARTKPVIVIPLTEGAGYDPQSEWTKAWSQPWVSEGVVPMIVPVANVADIATVSRSDVADLDWLDLEPLADRYAASEVVIAELSRSGSVSLRYVSANGDNVESMNVTPDTYSSVVEAVTTKLSDAWKSRNAVDYGRTTKLTLTIDLTSPRDWPNIRTRLAQVKVISNVDIRGLTAREALIVITHYGRPDQLTASLAQQGLELQNDGELSSLRTTAANRVPAVP